MESENVSRYKNNELNIFIGNENILIKKYIKNNVCFFIISYKEIESENISRYEKWAQYLYWEWKYFNSKIN